MEITQKAFFPGKIRHLSFAPHKNYIGVCTKDDIFIYDLEYDIKIRIYDGYYKGGMTAFHPSWKYLSLLTNSGNLVLFDLKRGKFEEKTRE